MKKFLMKALQLDRTIIFVISFLLLCSCVSQTKTSISDRVPQPYIMQPNNGLVYDASFQYKDFQASGILVLKRLGEAEYHVALLSKFGPTFMEFKLEKEGLTWIKTFEKFDKAAIEKLLERDFKIILLSILEKPKKVKSLERSPAPVRPYKVKGEIKALVKVDVEKDLVIYAENRGFFNIFKTKATFKYDEQDFPQRITVDHNNINLSLDLNLIKVNYAER